MNTSNTAGDNLNVEQPTSVRQQLVEKLEAIRQDAMRGDYVSAQKGERELLVFTLEKIAELDYQPSVSLWAALALSVTDLDFSRYAGV